mgnify:CR=1 FL=1
MLLVLPLGAVACVSSPKPQDAWPNVDVLPKTAPDGLDTQAATSVLRRGPSGMLYIVGGVDESAKVGDTFLARYSGEWPLKDLPRPPLAAGQITRIYDNQVALVQLIYMLPDTELDKLEITWQDDIAREDLGKGVASVEQVFGEPDYPETVELSIGQNLGVQPGDIYALVHQSPESVSQVNDLQLGKRLANICLIQSVTESKAKCRIWHGSRLHPEPVPVVESDTALFLEHTFGQAPRQALVQFAKIKGDDDGSIREHLIKQMQQYLNTHAAANITVEPLDEELDPTSATFYRNDTKVEYRGMPQLVIGAAILPHGKKQKDHLFLNYMGVGPASGPGMIAAPPEGGMNAGLADEIDGKDLRQIFGTAFSGILVYRGQTSEALMHLRQMLGDEHLQGAMRWHLRDQYAMRWASLGYVDEALWIVLEDEAVGKERDDRLAMLNALGTRVRLHQSLDADDMATKMAARYLELRQQGGDNPGAIASAQAMYAEMLLAQDEIDKARTQIANVQTTCVDECAQDLFTLLSGIYWAVPPGTSELQSRILGTLTELQKRFGLEGHAGNLLIYQGILSMQQKDFAAAQLAFLEAERIFTELKYTPSVLHAKYFTFLSQLSMDDPIQAFETSSEIIAMAQELRDYTAASRAYNDLINVYFALDMQQAPGTYIKLASRMLNAVYDAQVASGNLGKSSETLFTIGTLFFRLQALDDASVVLQKAVVYSIRATRFDIAAMSHLTLAMIARAKGDMEAFQSEISRAQTMAELSGDQNVIDSINRVLSPEPQEPVEAPPVDTKLL